MTCQIDTSVSIFCSKRQKVALLLLLLFLCFPGVMAQNISFADPDATVHKDILIYNATGSLVVSTNTTSNNIAIPGDSDLIFVIKPQYTNVLEDPHTFLTSAFSFVETNALTLIIMVFLVGLLFKRF